MARRLPRIFRKLPAWIARHIGALSNVVISLLVAAVGWFAVQWRELLFPTVGDEKVEWQDMGMDPLQRFSFDVPFVVRQSLPYQLRPLTGPPRDTKDVVILYMDEVSARELKQPDGAAWSRAMHARLLDWLTKDGARAVVFDLSFERESPDDAVLADSLRRNGSAFIGARIDSNTAAPLTPDEASRFQQVGIATEKLVKSHATLVKASRGWGLLDFRPIDTDYGARRLFAGKAREGLDPWPAITWKAAQFLGAPLPQDEQRFARRWLNYYGPTGRVESLSYHRALVENGGAPPGYFKDRVVFVGGRSEIGGSAKKSQDVFSTPWSRFSGRGFTPGVEVHATAFLNFLRGDWLERVPLRTERWLVVLFGLALGALRWLRPWRAVMLATVTAVVFFGASCFVQWHSRLWWNWAVPVCIQLPLATLLAVGSRYYLEERRKKKLRSAFGYYLSPELAEEIAERDFSLTPGGRKVVATMVFTDLEGFTTLSEKLGDSSRLADELIRYFTRTAEEILANKGMVIKFIGDSVFAAWGVPLPEADHAERAVRAAWRVAQVSEMDVEIPEPNGTTSSVRVRTRIGIHTGEAVAGNLGSARRFDYTLIGDAVNFASRLEGANKYTGTAILLSDTTAQLVPGKFLLRSLGAFQVKGKAEGVVIHELLGVDPSLRPDWLSVFESGLAAWQRRDLAEARRCFDAVIASRGGSDGPSELYLRAIDHAEGSGDWSAAITLEGK